MSGIFQVGYVGLVVFADHLEECGIQVALDRSLSSHHSSDYGPYNVRIIFYDAVACRENTVGMITPPYRLTRCQADCTQFTHSFSCIRLDMSYCIQLTRAKSLQQLKAI